MQLSETRPDVTSLTSTYPGVGQIVGRNRRSFRHDTLPPYRLWAFQFSLDSPRRGRLQKQMSQSVAARSKQQPVHRDTAPFISVVAETLSYALSQTGPAATFAAIRPGCLRSALAIVAASESRIASGATKP